MNDFTGELHFRLKQLASYDRKKGSEAYMRNQFIFIGVDTPTRRNVFKQCITENRLPPYEDLQVVINKMYRLERDMHYCAIELGALYRKKWDEDFIQIIEKLIVEHSWWDSVDAVASVLSSPYFKKFPGKIKSVTGRWNQSENIWLQRSSLLFQLKYKAATDTVLLSKYILNLSQSNEFFIQKAIGWILREYAKTNRQWVINFVSLNALKPLSRREALKHVSL